MISKPTVLILGAGASVPYGFPTGEKLRELILNRFAGSGERTLDEYEPMGFDERLVRQFRHSYARAGVKSIDAFLEHRPEFIAIGKTAIAEALIPFEDEHRLFQANPASDWYSHLVDKLNAPPEDFRKNQLSILTYNYDRSLEWYLYESLSARFGLKKEEVEVWLDAIPIIHLHGSLGGTPWEMGERRYEPKVDRQEIYKARDRIKIIHESVDGNIEFQKAQQLITIAKRVLFIGFGYNETNIQRLNPGTWPNGQLILGTAFDLTKLEIETAKSCIKPHMDFGGLDWDALKFLREKVDLAAS